jgi:hypothetical protein
MELYGVAENVIAERVGGLAGGGFLYQVIPIEMDANAAAAVFVRERFGADRIDEWTLRIFCASVITPGTSACWRPPYLRGRDRHTPRVHTPAQFSRSHEN